jgi:hypothetical protein
MSDITLFLHTTTLSRKVLFLCALASLREIIEKSRRAAKAQKYYFICTNFNISHIAIICYLTIVCDRSGPTETIDIGT